MRSTVYEPVDRPPEAVPEVTLPAPLPGALAVPLIVLLGTAVIVIVVYLALSALGGLQ